MSRVSNQYNLLTTDKGSDVANNDENVNSRVTDLIARHLQHIHIAVQVQPKKTHNGHLHLRNSLVSLHFNGEFASFESLYGEIHDCVII